MSATGRNLAGNERRADDFYATPAWVTKAILPHLVKDLPVVDSDVLDPCCGEGAILKVCREVRATSPAMAAHGMNLRGIELDRPRGDTCRAAGFPCEIGDALLRDFDEDGWGGPNLIITNPPYNLAQSFLERAFDEVGAGGTIAFLLRLNFLGSQKRASSHRAHPSDVYVLPRRPSFTGGGTDATEYCWMVWGPGRGNRWWMLDV